MPLDEDELVLKGLVSFQCAQWIPSLESHLSWFLVQQIGVFGSAICLVRVRVWVMHWVHFHRCGGLPKLDPVGRVWRSHTIFGGNPCPPGCITWWILYGLHCWNSPGSPTVTPSWSWIYCHSRIVVLSRYRGKTSFFTKKLDDRLLSREAPNNFTGQWSALHA